MSTLRTLLARIIGFFTGHRADDDMRAELESHLEMATEENIRRGMTPHEARRQALISSGGLTQASEAVRDQRGLPWLDGLLSDLRYATRALRRAPVFSAVVVVTLALGIGANTAIFSVVHGVLLKPLPHRDGDRLVYLRHFGDGPGRGNLTFSVPEVRDLRTAAPSLAGVAEYSSWSGNLQLENDALHIGIGLVTGNFFEVMGLSPVLGRVTDTRDDGAGAAPVMVLTHAFWQQRFGGDSAIVGQVVRVDNRPVTVIGVLQPAPTFPDRMDVLLNMVFSPHHFSALMVEERTHRMTEVVARLTPDASLSSARAEVLTAYQRMQNDFRSAYDPGTNMRVSVTPFREVLGDQARLTVWLLMGAAAFVLIICAANVANLTLMRGVRREPELVARIALGAGAGRLRRLLLAENLVLTLAGATLGIFLAIWLLEALTTFAARYSPRAAEIRLDAVVLSFAVALSLLVALLLSFIAALPKEGSLSTLISAARRASVARSRLQRGLVVAQVAASVMLLAGAGLLTRTMMQLANQSTGLEMENVLTMQVRVLGPTEARIYPTARAEARTRYLQIQEELATLPGVSAVGMGTPLLQRSDVSFDVRVEGRTNAPGEPVPSAELRTASPDYFRAAGIPLLRGRVFTDSDLGDTIRTMIVNQTLADQIFPGEDPIGKRLSGTDTPFNAAGQDYRTIVGVVGNTRDGGMDAPPRPATFFPVPTGSGVIIRTAGDAATLAATATRIVRGIAPSAPVENVLTISQLKDQSVTPRRLNALLISAFGLLALLMAAVGIAGVLAFSVSARTNEIGIRMSLGATGGRVQRMILKEGGVLLALGLALGLGGAFVATTAIQGLLFGVAPHDPVTFAGVGLLMAAIGALACWIPALRAARIDPAITMRAA